MTSTQSESPTQALYRAALGPLQTEHHLQAFAGFDERGRSGPRWNGLAALFTLNWLIYRRLWRMAALYLALLALGAGACVWAWQQAPEGVALGLVAVCGVLATAVPGLFANAWLHGQLRQVLIQVVQQAPSMAEAAQVLQQRAPSWLRLRVLGLVNVLLLAAAFAGGLFWVGEQAHQSPPVVDAALVAQPVEPVVPVPPTVVAAPAAAEPEPSDAPADGTATAPAAPAASEVPPSAPSAESASQPAVRSVSEPVALDTAGAYGINVGLFADPANAQRTLARIRQAGLPGRSDVRQMERGPRTRVRAGPFATRAEADEAAARIRALGLEALVFRQGASE